MIPKGQRYAELMQSSITTKAGRQAMDSHNKGISPAEYLARRGWTKRGISQNLRDILDGWVEVDFLDPVYGDWCNLDRALRIQFAREVESMGGYANFLELLDANCTPAWELEY